MCVYVYIYICITSLYNEVYTTKSLHYIIGINNIVNQLYLNKNKKKRKEKKQTNRQTHQFNEQSSAQYNFPPTCHL